METTTKSKNSFEIATTHKGEIGNVVCFRHADEILGRGIIINVADSDANNLITVQLDSVAMSNYDVYLNRLFDFMVLDEEVEMLFDDY